MARGGSRPGERRGGRQKGSRNKRTIARIALVETGGESPLDIMLCAARAIWRAAQGEDGALDLRKAAQAADIAKDAAPYVHARLAPQQPVGSDTPDDAARRIREAVHEARAIEEGA